MPPKHRDPKNSDLKGTNIKPVQGRDKIYYYYIMPEGNQEPLVHGDRRASIEAAIALNQHFRPAGDVVNRVLNRPPRPTRKNPLATEIIDQFKTDWLPKQGYAKRSEQERLIKLEKWKKVWPREQIGDLDTFLVAQFLKGLSAESARQHRTLLDQFFRFAASNGYKTQRPMIDIEKRKQEKRKRARHNWDGYRKIYEASPAWLRRAQDAALYTLQRRSDLVAIRLDKDVDFKARTIRVLQHKSENYDEPVYIDIAMGDDLFDVVTGSRFSGINCPYLIHCKPRRKTEKSRAAKPHPFAVLPDYLTRAYSEVRDKVGVYNHLPKMQRPGIHSLRALGVWLHYKAGHSEEYIMALAGHADVRMYEHYKDGHEKKVPVKVEAGLSLAGVDLSEINWETDLSEPLKQLVSKED